MEKNIERISDRRWNAWVELAKSFGFIDMAAAPAGDVKRSAELRSWVAQGFHGEMGWFARSLEKRLNPLMVMEKAASIIVLTIPYHAQPCELAGKKLARYACGDDYHEILLAKLRELCGKMALDIPEAHFRPYVDTGPVLERYWAQEAGIGWIGKNGNLISRRSGSYIFLAAILTDLRVPYGRPHPFHCGSCRACIDACPTEAIVADGVVDSRRCISYLTIEHRGPFENAPPFEDWIFGCDICQEVCPWTRKFSLESVLDAFRPRPAYESLGERALETMEPSQFSLTFRKSPIKRTKLAGMRRNAQHLREEEP